MTERRSAGTNVPSPAVADLTVCDREPIHIPGSIQPHGCLLTLREDDGVILQASANVSDFFGRGPQEILERPASVVFGEDDTALHSAIAAMPTEGDALLLHRLHRDGRTFSVVGHRADGVVVLEIEPDDAPGGVSLYGVHPRVAPFIVQVQSAASIAELSQLAASEVRRVTGFDRTLIYRFDADGSGIVTAEDRNENFPSLQDHRFPASDIPKQARELYRINRLRLIPNADYRPAPLLPPNNPLTNRPLDLSRSTLRSVSPVHVEYMRNMRTASSMSISIVLDGALWGLISCHHATPRTIPFETRTTCDLLAQVFALQMSARTHAAEAERRIELHANVARILSQLGDSEDFAVGLAARETQLLEFARANGAAIVTERDCHLLGQTPEEQAVRDLAAWLFRRKEPVFASAQLPRDYPPAEAFADRGSGLLAISISEFRPALVLWFRPEVIQTIRWGGDPRKSLSSGETTGRIDPRKSFETWRETVRQTATPWQQAELDAAGDLRSALQGLVLRRAEELAAVSTELRKTNEELERSNKELEAFSYSVSHDLRAPLRHIVGYAEILKEAAAEHLDERTRKCADTIIESSEYAGKLVDNLLSFSRMGRSALQSSRIDMASLAREVQQEVTRDNAERRLEWTVAELPVVEGDLMMLKLAVRNLFDNAVKYTRGRELATIDVGCQREEERYVFSVRDNGVGFDMRYQDKLFGVFQRLHRWEEYEGTGIGLANVRRIIERHGGRTWAEGVVNQGATFFFSLPVPPPRTTGV